ncbi:MAG TPA: S9 family peptidase [Blastocatellia bacterium]|nr:S9 family peptidase [Blastocatellia bacterium]
MAEKIIAPYGSWKSPITADLIVAGTVNLGEVMLDGDDIYWIEGRAAERGRNCIVRRASDGTTRDVTPPEFNARTTVHEYGGGAYVVRDGVVYFSNFSDQRLYRQTLDGAPQAITSAAKMRYADGVLDDRRNRMICVREDHTTSDHDCVNAIVSVNLDGDDAGTVIVEGNDFYSSPRLSPDGRQLAWLTWNHPNLPWDGTELWLAAVNDDGALGARQRIAGGAQESIFQPEWSPDGRLHFVSDRTGWWNLYRYDEGRAEALSEMQAEFGMPQWGFRMSTYGFASADEIVCAFNEQGNWRLGLLDTGTRRLEPIDTPYTEINSLRVNDKRAVFCGGSPADALAVVELDLATRTTTGLRRSSAVEVDAGYLSLPETVEFPTAGEQTAFAFFYAPRNRDYQAPAGEKPPLIVISHGGPTSAATTTLRLNIQYWTSRGFGVLDVNYGGSTGYGRAYRERLNSNWGITDVEDCINGARFLVEQGKADPERLIIRGGSAGGYTTLAALTFHDFFKVGASYYGVSDLELLEQDCHKFESRYNRSLIGPYPEGEATYKARSPIHHTERLSCPIILFQGLEDRVVPPNQAEMLYAAAKAKGLPVAYIPFAGEAHGFRQAANIKRSLDGELYFYSRVFGFDADVEVDPDFIGSLENFPAA